MFQASKDQQAFVAQQIESSAKEIKEHQKKNRENGWVSARFDDHVDIPCQSEQGQIGSFILSWDTKNGWGFLWVARFGGDQKLGSFSLLPGYVGIVASHYQDTFLNDQKTCEIMKNPQESWVF